MGTYVGIDRRTGQYMLHTGEGMVYARTVFRLPEANKWDKDELAKIKATPWSLHTPKDPEVVFKEKKDVEQQEETKSKITIARQPHLKASDFVEYGLTRGCPKCDHEISYGPGRTGKPHSQACKLRMIAELAKTPAGQARIAAASERLDRTVRELGEQHRTDVPQGEKETVVQHQTPPAFETPVEFVPLEPRPQEFRDIIEDTVKEHVSREAPPFG